MQNARLTVVDHPVVHDRLSRLRHRDTEPERFRLAMHQLSEFVAFEALRGLSTRETSIPTPLAPARCRVLAKPIVVVPILRAGLGMLHGVLQILPEAQVGHIGLVRNEETHRPESYYQKLPPDIAAAEVLLVDPMLATGHSAAAAVSQLKAAGARHIIFLCVIAAPEGVIHFASQHPEVPIYTAALDACLTHKAYISPGLGDAGDRYFGTH